MLLTKLFKSRGGDSRSDDILTGIANAVLDTRQSTGGYSVDRVSTGSPTLYVLYVNRLGNFFIMKQESSSDVSGTFNTYTYHKPLLSESMDVLWSNRTSVVYVPLKDLK